MRILPDLSISLPDARRLHCRSYLDLCSLLSVAVWLEFKYLLHHPAQGQAHNLFLGLRNWSGLVLPQISHRRCALLGAWLGLGLSLANYLRAAIRRNVCRGLYCAFDCPRLAK